MRSIHMVDEGGADTDQLLCWVAPADPQVAAEVLAAPIDDEGRSEWMWFRLQNGDLVLGCFPRGDTYLATEADQGRP